MSVLRSLPLYLFIITALPLVCGSLAVNAAGVKDGSFRRSAAGPSETSRAVDIQASNGGEILVAGNYAAGSGTTGIFINKFAADGLPSRHFGEQGAVLLSESGVSLTVESFLILSDGAILTAGSIKYADGSSDFLFFKVLASGTPDPGFGVGGMAVFDLGKADFGTSLTLAGDGAVIAAGGADIGGPAAVAIRITPEGRRDESFGHRGFAIHRFQNAGFFDISTPSDVEFLRDGSVRVGGDWEFALDGVDRIGSYLVTFSSGGDTGVLDATPYVVKNGQGCGASFDGKALPDGRYIHVSSYGGINRFHDGSDIDVLPDGRLVVAGGCLGGSLKVYDGADLHLIGVEKDLKIIKAAALSDGRIAVLGSENELIVLKGVTSAGTRQQSLLGGNKAEFSVYRSSERRLYINDGEGNVVLWDMPEGAAKIIPEMASFISSAEGVVTGKLGVWSVEENSPGSFSILNSDGGTYFSHTAGDDGDLPFAGDLDADGALDTGFFRSSEGKWYLKMHFASSSFGPPLKWGSPGDRPVPADYDGDGRTDLAVFRPSNGTWWIRRSSDGGTMAVQFGVEGDIPLTGDFDADGKADLTVYRPSEGNWYQYLTETGFKVIRFGIESDIPVPADYDGDGRTDIAVFRDGVWYLLQSTDGFKAFQWGSPGDRPVTARYDS